jgi:hypothetical protein
VEPFNKMTDEWVKAKGYHVEIVRVLEGKKF